MKSIIARVAFTMGCCLAMGIGGAACGNAPSAGQDDVATGKLHMPLVTIVNGHTYRLNGQFSVWGPISTWLQTSQDPAETYLSTTLQTGTYSAFLDSWQLERADDGVTFAPVRANLTSGNPVNFSVFANSTTTISFLFETDGVVVVVGSGSLRVTIGVTEIPPVCTPLGNDCPSGTWCAPTALTGQPLACIPAGTVAVGDPCLSPSECVANASCFDFGTSTLCGALCPTAETGLPCASGGTCQAAGTGYGVCRP